MLGIKHNEKNIQGIERELLPMDSASWDLVGTGRMDTQGKEKHRPGIYHDTW